MPYHILGAQTRRQDCRTLLNETAPAASRERALSWLSGVIAIR